MLEEEGRQLFKDIRKHLNKHGYTWKVADVITQYKNNQAGFYISHTAHLIIEHFESRLELYYGKRS